VVVKKYYWLQKKWQLLCYECGFKTILRSGSVIGNPTFHFKPRDLKKGCPLSRQPFKPTIL
jgi:hypothetical protein